MARERPRHGLRVVINERDEAKPVEIRRTVSEMAASAIEYLKREGWAAAAQLEADRAVTALGGQVNLIVDQMIAIAPCLDEQGAKNTSYRMILVLEAAMAKAKAGLSA